MLMPDGQELPAREYVVQPCIYAHSEQDDFVMASYLGRFPLIIMVTKGRDGDRTVPPLEAVGVTVVRGSSLRSGSEALRNLVELLRDSSQPCVLCVDGPLGPRDIAKPGALFCARESGRPVIPVAAAASHAICFRRSWARIYIPLPLAKVVVALGKPLNVEPAATREDIDDFAAELSRRLTWARQRALTSVNRPIHCS
jgi:lysophospholipid acyltransferase (LPLAT)-like uncharacterized protein